MRVLLLVIAFACRAGGTSFQPLPGVVMRSDPIGGWTSVTSPDRSYSFEMPGEPVALTATATAGWHFYQLHLEASSRGFELLVLPAPRSMDPHRAMERARDMLLESWTASLEQSAFVPTPHGEVLACSSIFTLTGHHAVSRIHLVGDRIFALSAIAEPDGAWTLAREAERFFRSFRMRGGS